MFVHKQVFTLLVATLAIPFAVAQKLEISWDKPVTPLKTTPTLQVVVNPPLRPDSPISERAYANVKRLGADYVRYVPWYPYPKLGVAELEPPANGKTSWDFSLIDPMTLQFFRATEGHSIILNFSTIPAWLFKTPQPVQYPQEPNRVFWKYTQGTELRDPSMQELANYYARLVSWYVNGGFTDELGQRHTSEHHFKIDYWEVLNEVDFEHNMSPQQYTQRYDAIVEAIHRVSPQTKFVGLALALPDRVPDMFEYFLNPKNHKPGIPLDMISYHFYATPSDEPRDAQQYTFFEQADRFLATARYIEAIRKRLSPETRTTVNEIGSISAEDGQQDKPGYVFKPIPNSYWNLSAAVYAYVFGHLAEMGIDVAGESQLVGYPTQFPSVSMVDWNTGTPNARFKVLDLLKNSFADGDKLYYGKGGPPGIYALGFTTKGGERKVLLVNKRNRDSTVPLPQNVRTVDYVDQTTTTERPMHEQLGGDKLTLRGFSVAVVTLSP